MSPEPTRIILRMSGAAKLVYAVTIMVCLWFVIVIIGLLVRGYDQLAAADLGGLLIGIIFFGGGAFIIARLMMKKAGYLEIRDDGLLLDTYFYGGFIPWDKLTAVGSVRAMGVKYLGIAIDDVESFVASRTRQPMLSRSRDQKLTQGFSRMMVTFAPTSVSNKIFYILGYTKLPDSPTEADLLKWNKENCGYHILIQSFWIQNMAETIAAISLHI